MKVTAYIRRRGAAKNNLTDMATVYFRVRDGRTDIKAASELTLREIFSSRSKTPT